MNANVSLRVCHDMECFGANTIYSKIHFIFKTRLPQRLKPKYYQTQFIIPEKSSSFWLKASKKLVITVRNLRMGYWLRIWWSGLKDLFSQFSWAKGVARFQGFFLKKMNSLKIKHLKKIHFCCSWIWQFGKRQDPPW